METVSRIFYIVVIGLLFSLEVDAQFVYHTPSGTKYHTSSCHMVDNTSNAISLEEARERNLKPCTFCKPDENVSKTLPESLTPVPKPGQKEMASQCLGQTLEGKRCARQTKNANGYCFQHLPKSKA